MKNKKLIYKAIILLVLITISTIATFYAQCPIEGNGKNAKEKLANSQKNREIVMSSIDTTITLSKILVDGNDKDRFSVNSFVKITGYLVEVKAGGKESCNCGSDIDSLNDVHIYIGQSPNAEKSDCMIVEITPRFKRLNKDLHLQLMKGKEVNVYGYIFYDEEHKGNAKNTCDKCTNTWRKTVVEIHPVCKIELK